MNHVPIPVVGHPWAIHRIRQFSKTHCHVFADTCPASEGSAIQVLVFSVSLKLVGDIQGPASCILSPLGTHSGLCQPLGLIPFSGTQMCDCSHVLLPASGLGPLLPTHLLFDVMETGWSTPISLTSLPRGLPFSCQPGYSRSVFSPDSPT